MIRFRNLAIEAKSGSERRSGGFGRWADRRFTRQNTLIREGHKNPERGVEAGVIADRARQEIGNGFEQGSGWSGANCSQQWSEGPNGQRNCGAGDEEAGRER